MGEKERRERLDSDGWSVRKNFRDLASERPQTNFSTKFWYERK